ncbi:MAG TPA: hypothetical protein VM012_05800 [Flavitalea sp.]|nr:hypothetical protein [Flavitalea sp.]
MKGFKKTLPGFFAVATICAMVLSSCVKVSISDDVLPRDTSVITPPSTILEGTIDNSVTLAKGKYTLKGYVYVNNNAILTIEAGSVIMSDVTEKGALIIERGSKLIADGRADAPIVFTSGKAANQRNAGDWGGIILLGKAPTNRPTNPPPVIEGGVNRTYGGIDPNDNSGILRFVRIEFSGIAAEPNSEINGLTLGGVGAGTILENIQVSYGADDGFEFFGGTVNAKNLVSFAAYDDDYDFDFGYTGKIQYAVSLRDKPADTDQANGIECDNDGSGTTATPYTKPQLSNLTLIGPYDTTGSAATHGFSARFRRSTRFVLRNSILLGHRMAGFSIESDNSLNDYKNNNSEFKNNIVAVYSTPYKSSNQTILTNADMKAKAEADGSVTLATREDVQLTDPFTLGAPNFLPKAGSPALTGVDYSGMDAFFTPATFRGAFGSTNWLLGWTSFTPKNNTY